jgi:hypothetical protein
MLDQGAPAGLRHFTCKFSHRVPLVQCPSEVIIKKTYKSAYAAFTLSFFFLPYRFAGYLHLSHSKRFMHMRPPSKKTFVQLPLTSGIHTFAAKTLLGANSP